MTLKYVSKIKSSERGGSLEIFDLTNVYVLTPLYNIGKTSTTKLDIVTVKTIDCLSLIGRG